MNAIKESTAAFESGGTRITLERFEPEASGRYPAILGLYGSGGMAYGGPAYQDFVRRLAGHGFVAFIVHYFDRTATRWADRATHQANFLVWMETIGDAVTHAARQPGVDPRRIGLVGFSLGAYLALAVAAADPRIGAVVEFFGGMPDPLAPLIKRMPPVLILHGEADLTVPVQEADKLRRLLDAKKCHSEIKIYPRQGHGFYGADARDAERRTLEFLEKNLKPRGTRDAPGTRREGEVAPTRGTA